MTSRIVRAADVAHWDDEADAVVVGLGAAGAAAALEAAASGAQTLVVDAASDGSCSGEVFQLRNSGVEALAIAGSTELVATCVQAAQRVRSEREQQDL